MTARGEGRDPSKTRLEGTIVAENVVLRLPNVRLPIENGQARVTLRGDAAVVERLAARVGRTTFDAKGDDSFSPREAGRRPRRILADARLE